MMRKLIKLFVLLLAITSYSQTTLELKSYKKELLERKDSLDTVKIIIEKKINLLNNKIDSLKNEIGFSEIRDNAVITTVKRDSKILTSPYSTSKSIANIYKNNKVSVVEYYTYGDYYKVIYKNHIGYIKESNLRVSKEVKSLKSRIKYKTNINSGSNISVQKELRKTNYRTYYRGPRGGCYYINSNGNKSYVSRSLCH